VAATGKKLTVGRYLLQLLAVRPEAFLIVRTKIDPDELDEEDKGTYQRMLETFDRSGPGGLDQELTDYPEADQNLIRRAWAAPPPNVEDDVAVELVERIRLDRMKGRRNAIIRELSEAERGRDPQLVGSLETALTELNKGITEMERRK